MVCPFRLAVLHLGCENPDYYQIGAKSYKMLPVYCILVVVKIYAVFIWYLFAHRIKNKNTDLVCLSEKQSSENQLFQKKKCLGGLNAGLKRGKMKKSPIIDAK